MTRLGPFELQKRVARGGMAVVWRAVHVEQRLPVAIKVMSERLAFDARHRREFFNEVRAVARLDHPNVVALLDFGEIRAAVADPSRGLAAGSPWLAMEWIEGRTLADATVWSWSRLKSVALDILDALAHAHARGVVHRDLKPANVMFAIEGERVRVKLTDFGIARHSDTDSEEEARVRGTPKYMAPEQILGMWRDQGPPTDLYALGCMMWRVLCGRAPFQRDDQEETLKAHLLDPLPEFEPSIAVPDGAEEFLRHLLARGTSRRFQYAADAAAALARLAEVPDTTAEAVDAFADTIVDAPTISVPVETLSVETSEAASAPQVATAKIPGDWRAPAGRRPEPSVVRAGLNLFGLREPPFVDREESRDRLWTSLRKVAEGAATQTVVVEGALGVGKTRVARWLAERAHEMGAARTLWVHHSEEFGERDGIGPAIDRTFQLTGLTRTEIENRIARGMFGSTSLDDDEALDVQAVLRLRSSDPGVALNPADRHRAFGRMLGALSRRRPVVVVFDDIQWGWEALELAHALRGGEHRVLVVVTAQTEALRDTPTRERVGELRDAPDVVAIDLEPLGRSDGLALVGESLALERGLAHRIAEWGAGNPLWTVQILGDLVEQQLLTLRDSGFGLRSGAQIHLPDHAADVYARRLGAALEHVDDAAAERALWVAATIGTTVSRTEWEDACRRYGIAASDALEETLLRRALVSSTDDGFVFSHPLAVEAVRRTIPLEERDALATVCLEALDALTHRERIEDYERRAQYLFDLDRLAEGVDAMFQALDYAQRIAEPPKIRALLDATAERVEQLDDARGRARLFLHESRFALSSDIDASRMWAEKALADGVLSTQESLHARALTATADRLQGTAERAVQTYAQVIAELSTGSEFLARTKLDYGLALKWLGRMDEASEQMTESAALFGDLGHQYYECRAIRYVGDVAFQQERYDEAERAWARARELAIASGDRVSVAACANVFGELERARGDFAAAAASYERAVDLFRDAGHWGFVIAGFNLGLAQFAGSDVRSAREQFESVRGEMAEQSLTSGIVSCDLALAACDVRLGDWEAGVSRFDGALEQIHQTQAVDRDLVDIGMWIAEDAQKAGRSDVAQRALDLVREQRRALGLDDEGAAL